MYSPTSYRIDSPETRQPLTETQHAVLTFIAKHVAEKHYPPTYREICKRFEWASTNAASDHVRALARKGYLELPNRDHGGIRGASRTLRVIHPVPAFAREGSA